MNVTKLFSKRNRRARTVYAKDRDGNSYSVTVFYDDLKATKHPPAWMVELEEQFAEDDKRAAAPHDVAV